jgi:outer membrane protein
MKTQILLASLLLASSVVPLNATAQSAQSKSPQPPTSVPAPNSPGAPASAAAPQMLTLQQAEALAIQNHPQIQAAMYQATAAQAEVTETKSAYYPMAFGSLTGVDAENNSRVAAGALNNPIIYNRYSNGVSVTQFITDFGRTHELVKSSSLHAEAEKENVVTSRADVLLEVDQAYFNTLKAQALLVVAQQTVKERQLVSDQVTELEKNKIKSGLDVSFANVDLAQAQLLLVQAQNNLDASYAELSMALGYGEEKSFKLVENPLPPAPPANFADLLLQAIQNRPELISLRLDANSAHSYALAERDLWFPTVSAAGAAGLTPVGADQLAPRYAAAGFNVNIPLFNGHLFGALRSEADANARAQDQNLRAKQDRIVRDVRTAWLNANSSFQNLSITEQLLSAANQALDLAQSRYKLGLSSIIELSQAQLNQTQAQIVEASAKYDYDNSISVLNYQIGALH